MFSWNKLCEKFEININPTTSTNSRDFVYCKISDRQSVFELDYLKVSGCNYYISL